MISAWDELVNGGSDDYNAIPLVIYEESIVIAILMMVWICHML